MALIICPECNERISDLATVCPHCGLPSPAAKKPSACNAHTALAQYNAWFTEVTGYKNEAIEAKVPITCEEMSVKEAKEQGAIGLFESKYGERVKTYTIGDFSKEICGGPHAARTSELGHFKIVKEQSCGSGIRRIKAILD